MHTRLEPAIYGLPVISEILTVLDPGFFDYCVVRSATEHYQSIYSCSNLGNITK